MSRFFNQSRTKPRVYESHTGNGSHQLDIEGLVQEARQNEVAVDFVGEPVTCEEKIKLSLCLPILAGANGVPHIAEEAYRALRTRLLKMQATEKITSIAITSSSAGEGKTLTCVNLALYYARLFNARILVLDGDLRTEGLSSIMSATSSPGLAEVLEGTAPFESAIKSTSVENLFVMGAGRSGVVASDLFAKPRWKELMEWCRGRFKLVLVDSPPILGLADFELIGAGCDGIVLVVRARRTEREVLQEAVGHLDAKKLLGIIFNGHEAHREPYYEYYTGRKRK